MGQVVDSGDSLSFEIRREPNPSISRLDDVRIGLAVSDNSRRIWWVELMEDLPAFR
jgi:hypothetical protein